MHVVGITGGIGSGKSSFCHAFVRLGITVIDTDQLAHQLTQASSAAMPAIVAKFGESAIQADGALNRTWMRQHIFSNPSGKQTLEKILHPLIYKMAAELIKNEPLEQAYCILAVPLLFETQLFLRLIDYSIAIDCEERLQIERVKSRSHLSEIEIRQIIATQMNRAQRNQYADEILRNDGTLQDIDAKVSQTHDFLLQKFKLIKQ
ncbi:dephospho-CoA kinase [Deefgea sp. CFH1-16]|uniref:dephospho-CoA kinase n=1 Tax=Deefgea sp. CFH1-16 TaxID=2675457 RepID=UPI0015F64746|nr:dephospho-CoA kinase [Deefgea sp. CFH1-16]MBM5573939.1 dephospho-CoA kinase [Deefgea sp. CFH1-16]